MHWNQHITEAEWQIMRAIWDKSPSTSKELIDGMNQTTGWEPTTVKTLLSRLVKKGALQFETKGRTFYYFPLVTEVDCVRSEMKQVVEKVYGGTLNRETEHFYFKGQSDLELIDGLAVELEGCYGRISEHLSYAPDHKILVYTHATQKRLHSALGVLEGPDWLRGGYLWGILHLAPKVCFTEIDVEKAAVHLLTQLMINEINPQVPYWLQQGISAYEGQWLTQDRIEAAVKSHKNILALSHLNQMSEVFISFKNTGGYELSYTVGEFMHQTFGYEKIGLFLRKPYAFEGILGCTEEDFWQQWRQFIDKRYH